MSFIERFVDERFLMHRLRSSSLAGIVGGTLAGVLFLCHLYLDRRTDWDLFAVLATIVVVKLALMIYFRLQG